MSGGRTVRLIAHRTPLAADALFAFLAARAIPGVESVVGHEYRRAIRTGSGDAMLRLRPAARSSSAMELIVASAEKAEPVEAAELAALIPVARRLLDLDADPIAIDRALATDGALRPLIAAHPGTRLPGTIDGFATTVLAILAQGVTLASARTIAGRIAQAYGPVVDLGDAAIVRGFPDPDVLAQVDLSTVGLAGRRAATIRAVAAAVAAERLDLGPDTDPISTLATLSVIPGIGPWTTGYVALRVLHETDTFPPNDAAVRAALRRLGVPSDAASIAARAETWRPFRGYALVHLWSMA